MQPLRNYEVLTNAELEAIHAASLALLEDTGLDILPNTQVPLPGDFVNSREIYEVDRGYIGFNKKLKVPGVYWNVQ